MGYRIPAFLYHILIWVAFVAITLLSSLSKGLENHSLSVLIWKYFAYYGINAVFFYFHYSFLVPYLLNNKKLKFYIPLTLFSILIFPFVHYLLYLFNAEVILNREEIRSITTTQYFSFVSGIFIYVIAATAIRFAVDNWKTRQKAKELEKEKSQAELNFLKAQVNPHFLFNAFNSLYALSLKSDKRLPDTILKLSDLMRYVLNYSQQNKTTLKAEIKLIEDYLEVQSIRLDDNFDLQFNKYGNFSDIELIPLIFLPIVENCFKHSDLSTDGFIHLDLKVRNYYISFITRNKIEENKNTNATGLENLKKRLQLIYKDQFKLNTRCEDGIFITHLEIPSYGY